MFLIIFLCDFFPVALLRILCNFFATFMFYVDSNSAWLPSRLSDFRVLTNWEILHWSENCWFVPRFWNRCTRGKLLSISNFILCKMHFNLSTWLGWNSLPEHQLTCWTESELKLCAVAILWGTAILLPNIDKKILLLNKRAAVRDGSHAMRFSICVV
jgi:hypothetical protein